MRIEVVVGPSTEVAQTALNAAPTPRNPSVKRKLTMSLDVKYRATVSAVGGREGRARSEDGRFAVALSIPKELGGPGGEGTNPEQLFAAGYSACFLGALQVAARNRKLTAPAEATVTATIGIGPRAEGGFGLSADLVVNLPGLERSAALDLVQAAHQICPYSNATRDNIDVTLTVA